MTAFLALCTEFLTAALGWVGQVATVVKDEPLMLVPILMGIAGFAIGLFKRAAR